MNFHVGQKVQCISDRFPRKRAEGIALPVKGGIYHIREIARIPYGCGLGLLLCEIANDPDNYLDGFGEPGFQANKFRPVIEHKTDISIFTAMLKQKQREHEPTI